MQANITKAEKEIRNSGKLKLSGVRTIKDTINYYKTAKAHVEAINRENMAAEDQRAHIIEAAADNDAANEAMAADETG